MRLSQATLFLNSEQLMLAAKTIYCQHIVGLQIESIPEAEENFDKFLNELAVLAELLSSARHALVEETSLTGQKNAL